MRGYEELQIQLRELEASFAQKIASLEAENEDLRRRMKLVEKQQGYLADRPPIPIPPFPRILVDMGYRPPEGMKVSG